MQHERAAASLKLSPSSLLRLLVCRWSWGRPGGAMARMQRSSPCRAGAAAMAACPGGGLTLTPKSCSLCLGDPSRRPPLQPPHPPLRPPIPELSLAVREYEFRRCCSFQLGVAGICACWCWLYRFEVPLTAAIHQAL